MPSLDRTFSHRDVLRIYRKHLTDEERQIVDNSIGFPDDIHEVFGPMVKIARDGEQPVLSAQVVIGILALQLERLHEQFGVSLLPELDSLRVQFTRGADTADSIISYTRRVLGVLPGVDDDEVEDLVQDLVQIRGMLRTAATTVAIPRALVDEIPNLTALVDGLDGLGAEIRSLRSAIEAVFADDDPF